VDAQEDVMSGTLSNAGEAVSALFKPIAGGYLFQRPNPWVFGRTTRYIVSEAQREGILAVIRPRRPVLRVAVITAAVLAWAIAAATIVWALSPHADPTASDALAIFALVLLPIYGAWVVALQRNLRRIEPFIAGALRTNERITSTQMRRAMAKTISLRALLIYAALWSVTSSLQVFTLVMRNGRHPLFSDVQSFLNLFTAVAAAGLALHYLAMAVRKMRRPASAQA
jgi:hypothetical protein